MISPSGWCCKQFFKLSKGQVTLIQEHPVVGILGDDIASVLFVLRGGR